VDVGASGHREKDRGRRRKTEGRRFAFFVLLPARFGLLV
jgi:hypothetical protein